MGDNESVKVNGREFGIDFNHAEGITLLLHPNKLYPMNGKIFLKKVKSFKDIKGLKKRNKIERLLIYNTSISSFDDFPYLPNLKYLELSENDFKEISGVENLAHLSQLRVINDSIEKINDPSQLVNLKELWLSKNKIREIHGLEILKNLQNLYLDQNQISEINELSALRSLNVLSLNDNRISEIKGLDNLVNLRSLVLSGNQITEIKGLNNLRNLVYLNISRNRIREIKNISHLNLNTLYLNNNIIIEIENLKTQKSLSRLNLSFNQIIHIKNLEYLTSLKHLILNDNNIHEVKGLQNFFGYELMLWNNPIKSTDLNYLRDKDIFNGTIKDPDIIKRIRELCKKKMQPQKPINKPTSAPVNQTNIYYINIEPQTRVTAIICPSCQAPLEYHPPCRCEHCGVMIELIK